MNQYDVIAALVGGGVVIFEALSERFGGISAVAPSAFSFKFRCVNRGATILKTTENYRIVSDGCLNLIVNADRFASQFAKKSDVRQLRQVQADRRWRYRRQ